MVKDTCFASTDGVRNRVQLRGGQDVHGPQGQGRLLQRAQTAGVTAGRWVAPDARAVGPGRSQGSGSHCLPPALTDSSVVLLFAVPFPLEL